MTVLTVALTVGLTVLSQQKKDDKDVVVGMWKIDQSYGIALEAAKYDKPLDWIITFTKDGKYVWRVYDPFIEGVGRRHRETKGTFIVNLNNNRVILKTSELTGRPVAIEGVLDAERRSFVIGAGEKGYNVYQDRRMKFLKVEVRKPAEPADGGGSTGGGGATTGGG